MDPENRIRPQTPEEDDRTPSPRARKRLMVRYGPDAPQKTGFTGNVSENGLHVKSANIFAPGTMLHLEIVAPDRSYSMMGRVVWAKKVPARLVHITASAMGIYIKDPGPDWREFCVQWAKEE